MEPLGTELSTSRTASAEGGTPAHEESSS
jgi:hypothetical protein